MLKPNEIRLIRRSLSFLKGYKLRLIYSVICIMIGILLGLIQPLIWGKTLRFLFDRNLHQIRILLIYMAILFCSQMSVNFIQLILSTHTNTSIVNSIRQSMYMKILDMPVKAFDEISIGEFISRIHGDASTLSDIITNKFVNVLVDIFRVIAIGIAVFSINFKLGLIVVTTFPFTYIIFVYYGNKLKQKSRVLKRYNDEYFRMLQQSISGIREIKHLGLKTINSSKFNLILNNIRNNLNSTNITSSISQILSESVSFISGLAIIYVGGYFINENLLTIELFIAFSSYSKQFANSLINITNLNSNLQQSIVSLERIFEIMDNLIYENEKFGRKSISSIEGNISFKNVNFGYDKNKLILKSVNLQMKANQKTAIVGKSGSGKTTIFNLLLKFYEPHSGNILIDNIDENEFDEDSLRKNIAVVRQDPILFNTTIKENFIAVNSNATQENIIDACKAAYIHDYIMTLPMHYESIVEENGNNFSVGQRQRLAIARAIIKKSKIVLFDEATSALDNESQFFIKKSLDCLVKNHTIIIIAHRLLTIIDAHKIILVDEGEIVACGTHTELMKSCSKYRDLYEREINAINELERRSS